jgi:AcrR family transcriptional regulator
VSTTTQYESIGRSQQKRRTREALMAAARQLVEDGQTPTVEQAAERAGISRTTAYRYFPNQRSLVLAAHPETGLVTLLPENPPADLRSRLDTVVVAFIALIRETEAAQRTMLRLSLDPDPAGRGQLPLRQGRAVTWIAEALDPLHATLTKKQVLRLALAIRSAIGIEALVWLTDIGGLSHADAASSMRWSAHALLNTALTEPPPVARGRTVSSSPSDVTGRLR